MPIDYTKYPPNWKALRTTVMARAEERCECTGACGSVHHASDRLLPRCDAPHHARIVRPARRPAQWDYAGPIPEAAVIRVVLTIAHLCHDPSCDDLDHLRAFCQRCHLKYDAAHHARNASRTRRLQREAQGQTSFLPTE